MFKFDSKRNYNFKDFENERYRCDEFKRQNEIQKIKINELRAQNEEYERDLENMGILTDEIERLNQVVNDRDTELHEWKSKHVESKYLANR